MENKNDDIDNILVTSFPTPKILDCQSPTKPNYALLYREEKERADKEKKRADVEMELADREKVLANRQRELATTERYRAVRELYRADVEFDRAKKEIRRAHNERKRYFSKGQIGAETIDASLDACLKELRSFLYSLTMPDPKLLWKYAEEHYSLVVAWKNEEKAYFSLEVDRKYRDREYENQKLILIHRLSINQCEDVEKDLYKELYNLEKERTNRETERADREKERADREKKRYEYEKKRMKRENERAEYTKELVDRIRERAGQEREQADREKRRADRFICLLSQKFVVFDLEKKMDKEEEEKNLTNQQNVTYFAKLKKAFEENQVSNDLIDKFFSHYGKKAVFLRSIQNKADSTRFKEILGKIELFEENFEEISTISQIVLEFNQTFEPDAKRQKTAEPLKMDQKLEKILAVVNKLSSEVKSLKSQPRSAWIAPVGTPSYSTIAINNLDNDYLTHVFILEAKYQEQQFKLKKFAQRMDGVKNENNHLHTLFKDIIRHIKPKGKFIMRHEQSLARPDFIFVEKTAPKKINPIYTSFVVELLFNNEKIDNKHIGKVIYYNQEILICNPTREFIISAVSNLHDIMFIKTEAKKQKTGKDHYQFSLSCSKHNFWEDGIKYLKQLIEKPDQAGFTQASKFEISIPRMIKKKEEIVTYRLHRFIGRGLTARVYSLIPCGDKPKECRNMVVKIFSNKEYFDNETEIMNQITDKIKIENKNNSDAQHSKIKELVDGTRIYDVRNFSNKFIHRLADNRKKLSIVYTPRGQPLQTPLTRQQFAKMFDCVRELANRGIIHRDLTPNHFLSAKTSSGIENIFLIDFGSATFIEKEDLNSSKLEAQAAKHGYLGSVRFAATSILDSIVNKKEYIPHRCHDLESFVKTFYILHVGDNSAFGNEPDDKNRFNSALAYWKRFEENADLFWRDALKITKSEDKELGKEMLNNLFDHLNKFPVFKFDYDTNVDVVIEEKRYQKTRKLENIKEGVEKDEEDDDDDEDEDEDDSNMNLDY